MTMETAAKLEHKGYNRGLILGLTMAESMLLLVFCLLLVAGAFIANERKKSLAAEKVAAEVLRDNDKLVKEAEDRETLVAKLEAQAAVMRGRLSMIDKRELDDEWRELVVAREAVRQLKGQGLDSTKMAELLKTVEILRTQLNQPDDPRTLEERISELLEATKTMKSNAELQAELARLLQENATLATSLRDVQTVVASAGKPHEWPPIISLSEASGYYFRSGSAELTDAFAAKLAGSIADEIASNLNRYDADIIEVIGHTDEQPLARPNSNMDKLSIDVVGSKQAVSALIPADNAGLGLARAISVANALRTNKAMAAATVLPLSAAQLVLPGDTLTTGQAGDVQTRRRIEIRIRRRDAGSEVGKDAAEVLETIDVPQ
ncbi:OmpA family protein [Ensifer canadensis]|uniref:OmpA family protein n=1 Tax=Ensifer canadensis TaxID=555315 RepID=UPI001F16FEB7|nr:OmpA family protein [Ensifer canadensis]